MRDPRCRGLAFHGLALQRMLTFHLSKKNLCEPMNLAVSPPLIAQIAAKIFKLFAIVLFAVPSDTECRQEYETALKNYAVGRYVPRCRPDGRYEPLQCHATVCFCVDQYGKEISGSRKSAFSPPSCLTLGMYCHQLCKLFLEPEVMISSFFIFFVNHFVAVHTSSVALTGIKPKWSKHV